MLRKIYRIIASFLAFSCLTSVAFADESPRAASSMVVIRRIVAKSKVRPMDAAYATVRGRVTTESGRPIAGAIVDIIAIDGVILRTRTNGFGHFFYSDIPIGFSGFITAYSKSAQFPTSFIVVSSDLEDVILRPVAK